MQKQTKKVKAAGKGLKMIAFYLRHGFIITDYHNGSFTLAK